jgi:hypothetical protein
MDNKYALLRLRQSTVRQLKLLASLQGTSMIALVERFVHDEELRLHINTLLLEPTASREREDASVR